jgi:hypothetical protein
VSVTGLGNILLELGLDSLGDEDLRNLESVTLMLRLPSDKIIDIIVPEKRLDKSKRLAWTLHEITQRGQYRLGGRLHFVGGTSITSTTSCTFSATDGMA